MSQVRKLQPGGTQPEANKSNLYKLVFDDQVYTINDDQLQQISNGISNLDFRLKQYLGGVPSAIKSGDFNGDDIQNLMSINALTGLNERQLNFLRKQKKTVWEAAVDAPTYQAKEAINAGLAVIKKVLNSKPSESNTSKTKIGSDEIVLDFNIDDEGNYRLSNTAGQNFKAKNRVKQILEHLSNGESSTYNTDGWDFEAINGWLDTLKNKEGEDKTKYELAQEYISDLWNKLSNGEKLTADEEDLLANFFIKGSNKNDKDNAKEQIQVLLKKEFPNNPDLYDAIEDNFERGKDGVWRLKSDSVFTPGVELKPGQGIFFNDDYFKQFPTANRNALRNLTFIGNALYNLNDPKLAEILESTGYNKYMRSGNFDAADNIIRSRFTESELENPGTVGPEQYSVYFGSNPRHRFINVTGLVDVLDPTRIAAGDQIVKEIDLDDPDVNDGNPYVSYTYKYRILDRFGNDKGEIDSKYIREKPDGQKTTFKAYSRITGTGDSKYEGMYYIGDDTDANGKEIPIRFYYDPKDDSKVILHLPNISANGVDGGDLLLPPQIATILKDNNDLIDVLVGNPNLLSNFRKMMSKLVQSKTRAFDIDFINMRNQFEKMKFSKEQAKALAEGIKDYVRQSKNRFDRRDQSIVYKPAINKMGGKVNYIKKLAAGGVSGGSTETESAKLKRNVTLKNPASAKAIGDGTKLREADIADIVALVADAGSMVTTFADPTNFVGAATGAVGSLSRFRADTLRKAEDSNGSEGKGAGWNLLLNLGMDAASLIPVAGDAVQAAKFARNLRKALPSVLRFISYAGLGDAVATSAKKIANGEKWTIRDLSILVNGLTAGANAYRLGGFGRTTKTVKTKSVPEKVKIGNDERDLPNAAIERILNRPASKQKEQTIAELKEIFGDSVDSKTLEKEADNLLRSRRNLWQRITRKDGDMVLDTKKDTKNKNIEAETAFGKWWRRQNEDIDAYTKRIAGEVPQQKVTTKVERKGVAKVRKDIAEANGTTPNAEYYQDEYGTWYRKGKTNEQAITEKQYARMKPGRTAINDKNGNFTGKVKVVEEVKPFNVDAAGNPIFTETVENYVNKRVPWNIVAPHFLIPFHTHTDVEYSPQYNKNGGILKRQSGGGLGSKIHTIPGDLDTIKTIIKRIRGIEDSDNYTEQEIVLDGDVPDDKLVQMYSLQPEQLIYGSDNQLTGIYDQSLTGTPFTVTREVIQPSGRYRPKYGPEGKIIGWELIPEEQSPSEPQNPISEEPVTEEPVTEEKVEEPMELAYQASDSDNKNASNAGNKQKKKADLSTPKYDFITKNFGIKNPTITDINRFIIPVTNQKISKFKTNNKEDITDLIHILTQIYEDKNNNVVKGSNGIPGINPNWKPKVDWNPYLPKSPYPELPEWSNPKLDESKTPWQFRTIDVENSFGLPDFHLQPNTEKYTSSNDTEVDKKPVDNGGGGTYNLSDKSKWILPGLSAFRYINTLRNQRAYRDIDKLRINAARYDEIPVWANLARTDNSAIARALRQVHEERMSDINSVSNNPIINDAIKRQRDSQLLDRERDLISTASQYHQERELENLNISNQNLGNQILTANRRSERGATIDSASYNPDLEYTLRRDASDQAATIEGQNNIKRDKETMLALTRAQYRDSLNRSYNDDVDLLFPGARAAYENLDAEQAMKYYDFEDYLKQEYKDLWVKYKFELTKKRAEIAQKIREWEANQALSGYLPRSFYGKQSSVGTETRKKGGTINGRTRYTLEPDERIWIDNNKATHSQIAKLSEATIKLLLRALK